MDPVLILRSDQPILKSPSKYERLQLVPSSREGFEKCVTRDGQQVVSVLPDGTVILNPIAGHDGGYEAAKRDGNRLAYDYEGMTGDPVVFDIVVMS